MSKLTSFYENLVLLCGIKVGDYGRLAVETGEEDFYLKYDAKHLVFPEKQYLTSPDNPVEDTITFHPLSESSIRGASEVQDLLRKAAIVHLNDIGRHLLAKAVEINRNATADSSFKMTPKQNKLFANIGEIDEKFMKFWMKVENKMATESKSRLFDIYLKQHGEVDNKRFDRICTISSPLYDAIEFTKDNTIFGVTADRKKDLNTLKEVLKTLFPRLESGGYISGSSSNIAPFLTVFIEGLTEIETRFNDILLIYGKEANGTEGLYCKGLDIMRDVDLGKIRNMIPADKPYNIGISKDKEVETSSESLTGRRKPTTSAEPEVRQPRGLIDNLQATATKPAEPAKSEPTSSENKPFWMTSEDNNRREIRSHRDQGYSENRDYRDNGRDYGRRDDYRSGGRDYNSGSSRYGTNYGGNYDRRDTGRRDYNDNRNQRQESNHNNGRFFWE